MSHILFVYGTLKQGFHNHHCLGDNARFLGIGVLPGFQMYHLGGFPAIAPWEPSATQEFQTAEHWKIHGELYEVDDKGFKSCDRLEGYPDFYNRTQVKVITEHGTITAWVYHFDKAPKAPLVKDGNWK